MEDGGHKKASQLEDHSHPLFGFFNKQFYYILNHPFMTTNWRMRIFQSEYSVTPTSINSLDDGAMNHGCVQLGGSAMNKVYIWYRTDDSSSWTQMYNQNQQPWNLYTYQNKLCSDSQLGFFFKWSSAGNWGQFQRNQGVHVTRKT